MIWQYVFADVTIVNDVRKRIWIEMITIQVSRPLVRRQGVKWIDKQRTFYALKIKSDKKWCNRQFETISSELKANSHSVQVKYDSV